MGHIYTLHRISVEAAEGTGTVLAQPCTAVCRGLQTDTTLETLTTLWDAAGAAMHDLLRSYSIAGQNERATAESHRIQVVSKVHQVVNGQVTDVSHASI